MKKLILNLFKVLLAIFIVLLIFIFTGNNSYIKQQASKFCEDIKIGEHANGLYELALKTGANKKTTVDINSKDGRLLLVVFSGYYHYPNASCKIKINEYGFIVSKHYSFNP